MLDELKVATPGPPFARHGRGHSWKQPTAGESRNNEEQLRQSVFPPESTVQNKASSSSSSSRSYPAHNTPKDLGVFSADTSSHMPPHWRTEVKFKRSRYNFCGESMDGLKQPQWENGDKNKRPMTDEVYDNAKYTPSGKLPRSGHPPHPNHDHGYNTGSYIPLSTSSPKPVHPTESDNVAVSELQKITKRMQNMSITSTVKESNRKAVIAGQRLKMCYAMSHATEPQAQFEPVPAKKPQSDTEMQENKNEAAVTKSSVSRQDCGLYLEGDGPPVDGSKHGFEEEFKNSSTYRGMKQNESSHVYPLAMEKRDGDVGIQAPKSTAGRMMSVDGNLDQKLIERPCWVKSFPPTPPSPSQLPCPKPRPVSRKVPKRLPILPLCLVPTAGSSVSKRNDKTEGQSSSPCTSPSAGDKKLVQAESLSESHHFEDIPLSPSKQSSEEEEADADYIEVPVGEGDEYEWEVIDGEAPGSAVGLPNDGRYGWTLEMMRRAVE